MLCNKAAKWSRIYFIVLKRKKQYCIGPLMFVKQKMITMALINLFLFINTLRFFLRCFLVFLDEIRQCV